MVTTTLADEMLKNFVQLNSAEQKSILQLVQTFLKSKNNTPQTMEEYNLEINNAIKAAKKGKTVTVTALEKEMEKW
jgi:hypothetical protein